MFMAHEAPTLPEHQRFARVARSLFFCVVFCGPLLAFVLFSLAIVLSALHQLMTSDYPFE
jgi:hypothetical protein